MDNELKNQILKSGTTIVGIVCKEGIIMASDRQSTAGNIVMDKGSEKIIPVNISTSNLKKGKLERFKEIFKKYL